MLIKLSYKNKKRMINKKVLPNLLKRVLVNRLFYAQLNKFRKFERKITRRSRIIDWCQINALKLELNFIQKTQLVKCIQKLKLSRKVRCFQKAALGRNIKCLLNIIRLTKYKKKWIVAGSRLSRCVGFLPYFYKLRLTQRKYRKIRQGFLVINSNGFFIKRKRNVTTSILNLAGFLAKTRNTILLNSVYRLCAVKYKRPKNVFKKKYFFKGKGMSRDLLTQPLIKLDQSFNNDFRRLLPIITITFKDNNLFFVLSNAAGNPIIILSSGHFAKENKQKISSVPAYNFLTKEFARRVRRFTRICGLRVHGTSRRKFPVLKNLQRSGIRFAYALEHHAVICNGVRKCRKRRK